MRDRVNFLELALLSVAFNDRGVHRKFDHRLIRRSFVSRNQRLDEVKPFLTLRAVFVRIEIDRSANKVEKLDAAGIGRKSRALFINLRNNVRA